MEQRNSRLSASSLAAISILTLAACGSPAPKKVEAPPEPVTGLHALYQMFAASHAWAPDAQVFQFSSIVVPDLKPVDGKAGAWRVVFYSPSKAQSKTYTFAVEDVTPSLPKGILGAREESWNPPSSTLPFVIAAAKADTDKAWEVASKKGEEYSAKNPNLPITYQLELTKEYGNAVWRVMWGESASTSGFSVLVDATTGQYVKTLR